MPAPRPRQCPVTPGIKPRALLQQSHPRPRSPPRGGRGGGVRRRRLRQRGALPPPGRPPPPAGGARRSLRSPRSCWPGVDCCLGKCFDRKNTNGLAGQPFPSPVGEATLPASGPSASVSPLLLAGVALNNSVRVVGIVMLVVVGGASIAPCAWGMHLERWKTRGGRGGGHPPPTHPRWAGRAGQPDWGGSGNPAAQDGQVLKFRSATRPAPQARAALSNQTGAAGAGHKTMDNGKYSRACPGIHTRAYKPCLGQQSRPGPLYWGRPFSQRLASEPAPQVVGVGGGGRTGSAGIDTINLCVNHIYQYHSAVWYGIVAAAALPPPQALLM
eukprot:gene18394-biopygen8400